MRTFVASEAVLDAEDGARERDCGPCGLAQTAVPFSPSRSMDAPSKSYFRPPSFPLSPLGPPQFTISTITFYS